MTSKADYVKLSKSMDPVIQTPNSPTKGSSGNSVAILSIAGFILVALGVIIFLYTQNQALKEKLVKLEVTPILTPTESPSPTPNANLPVVKSPSPGSTIKSPLKISGTVPSGWMFEGVFPIKLVDSNKKTITQVQAKEVTPGSWQNGNPVEFTATLTFKTASGSGTIILENDNPSGDPKNSKSFEIPINF